jgi:hypothetical protein
MGLHSGLFGVLDGVSTVRNWSVNDSMSPHEYVASNTLFGTGRVDGVREWNGAYACYGHTPPIMPGELFDFVGYTAPNDDVSGVGLRYQGDALVENVKITWGWQGGDIINVSSDFKGHLRLLCPMGPERYDVTVPRVPSVIGTKIMYSSDGVSFTEWENLLSAELTIVCKLQEYVNSSSFVATPSGNELWKGHKRGAIDWTASVTVQDTIRTGLQIGQSYVFRFYVTSSLYWELKWGKVQEFTGLVVERETQAIMQHTVPLGMNGFDEDALTYDAGVGHILQPDTTQYWPATQPGTGSGA